MDPMGKAESGAKEFQRVKPSSPLPTSTEGLGFEKG